MRIGLFLGDFEIILQVSETGNAAQQRIADLVPSFAEGSKD
jgi:hypothetical protein